MSKEKLVRCGFITNMGKGCSRMVPDGSYCFQHCNRAYNKYKKICDPIRKTNCTWNKGYHENKRLMTAATDCKRRRSKFLRECVDYGCDDQRHQYELNMMSKKVAQCQPIVYTQQVEFERLNKELEKKRARREKMLAYLKKNP